MLALLAAASVVFTTATVCAEEALSAPDRAELASLERLLKSRDRARDYLDILHGIIDMHVVSREQIFEAANGFLERKYDRETTCVLLLALEDLTVQKQAERGASFIEYVQTMWKMNDGNGPPPQKHGIKTVVRCLPRVR